MKQNRRRVVYLAGPYRPYTDEEGVFHSIPSNVRNAGNFGIEIWKRGDIALVPHTLTYLNPSKQRQDGSIKDISAEAFMSGELELIRRSDVLVLMPEWRRSRGATVEKQFAEEIGVPVMEWEEYVEQSDAGRRNELRDQHVREGTETRNRVVEQPARPIDTLSQFSCATGRGKGTQNGNA